MQVIKNTQKNKRKMMSEMNMTPLIDVMLVLLVIFMITAPLLTIGVKVDLPKVNAPGVEGNDTPIIVFVDEDGSIFLGDVKTDLDSLPAKLEAIVENGNSDPRIFVKGDKSINYGKIMEIMGNISKAGFKKVVLVTEMPRENSANDVQEKQTQHEKIKKKNIKKKRAK